ncbi:MAG TPA: glucosaminidase domain-containing protein [Sphingobacteriaceae bacterium]
MRKLLMFALILFATAATAQTSTSYIEKYKDAAIRAMNIHGVPASIILGVAMHESGNGTSKIARHLNNHFGIKGSNNSKEIRSAYKGYGSVEESYDDFIGILQRRSQFSWLFDHVGVYDYRSWALAIQKGGYAQSRTWASQVMAIIKKFKLYEFDKPTAPMQQQLASAIPSLLMAPVTLPKKEVPKNQPAAAFHTVKKGETLSGIAKKYKTSVKEIQHLNRLKGTLLHPGQKLKL